jgi:hypothetical protein
MNGRGCTLSSGTGCVRSARPSRADAPRQLASINARSKQILELLLNGFRDEAWKQELQQIEQRRNELEAVIAAGKAEPPPPALHPNMARVFEQKIEQLAVALEHEDAELREKARQALRVHRPDRDSVGRCTSAGCRGFGLMLTAASGRDGSALAAVGNDGCGGVQPAVLAAVERGGVTPVVLQSVALSPVAELLICRAQERATRQGTHQVAFRRSGKNRTVHVVCGRPE